MKQLVAIGILVSAVMLTQSPTLRSNDGKDKPLGNLNSNRYDPNSVSNPYGRYGSPYSPDSVNNPFGLYGSKYSPYSAKNPHATQAPKIVTPDGKYLGKFSANPFDPDSTANVHGRYGSPYSPDSINNHYGRYGSPYSPESVRNPYVMGTGELVIKPPTVPKWGSPAHRLETPKGMSGMEVGPKGFGEFDLPELPGLGEFDLPELPGLDK